MSIVANSTSIGYVTIRSSDNIFILYGNMPKPPKFQSNCTVAHKILKGTQSKVDKVLKEYDKIKFKDKKARLKLCVVRLDGEELENEEE